MHEFQHLMTSVTGHIAAEDGGALCCPVAVEQIYDSPSDELPPPCAKAHTLSSSLKLLLYMHTTNTMSELYTVTKSLITNMPVLESDVNLWGQDWQDKQLQSQMWLTRSEWVMDWHSSISCSRSNWSRAIFNSSPQLQTPLSIFKKFEICNYLWMQNFIGVCQHTVGGLGK